MAKPSVLIVDDEPSVRQAVEDALKREGYDLFYAESGEQGLAIVDNIHPTVIILDLVMPGMGGLEFVANLKLSLAERYSLIVLSGHGDADGRRECFDAGINIILRKPFDIYEIRGVVRNAVAMRNIVGTLDELENRVRDLTALNEDADS